jgi:hypothetical protein
MGNLSFRWQVAVILIVYGARIRLQSALASAVEGIEESQKMAAAVIGDTAVVAAALQEMADAECILCSDTTARLVQGAVLLEASQLVQGAGQSTAVMVYKVLGIGPRRSPMLQHGERALSRFVGREREMATLQALLAQVEDGRGQVVGIAGEPGIGKSRLVYEFRRSLTDKGLTYLDGRCLSYGSSTPYLPLLDIIRHNCDIADAYGPEAIRAKVRRSLEEVGMAPDEWEPYLLPLLGVPEAIDRLATLSPQAIKARTFATLTQLCLNGSRRRPLLLEIKHVLTQEVAYESLLQSTRQQIHQRIAQVLIERFPEIVEAQPELLAHHFTEAGLGEQAIGFWQRAGQRANQCSAHAEAIVHLTKGLAIPNSLLDAPERSQQELSLQIALGTSLTATKGWAASEVKDVYIRARDLCQRIGETPQLSPALWGLWHFHAVRAEPQIARELGEQLLGLVAPSPVATRRHGAGADTKRGGAGPSPETIESL